MNIRDLIVAAIRSRKSIKFQYLRIGKVKGIRYGNPHAIYTDKGTNNINLHIYQISGVSDSGDPLPGWRTISLRYISDLSIIDSDTSFSVAPGYNPRADMYKFSIEKI